MGVGGFNQRSASRCFAGAVEDFGETVGQGVVAQVWDTEDSLGRLQDVMGQNPQFGLSPEMHGGA
ncbi:hypothetical protein HQ520_07715 [bacterium]|nr:hypothetical protein [bacterium]